MSKKNKKPHVIVWFNGRYYYENTALRIYNEHFNLTLNVLLPDSRFDWRLKRGQNFFCRCRHSYDIGRHDPNLIMPIKQDIFEERPYWIFGCLDVGCKKMRSQNMGNSSHDELKKQIMIAKLTRGGGGYVG